MPYYLATFRVSPHTLGKILDMGCELLSATPEATKSPQAKKIARFRTAKTSSRQVLVDFLKKNPHSGRMALLEVIVGAGYSSNTISPAISELRKAKKIVQHPDGSYTAR
jgi:hypothetical protein